MPAQSFAEKIYLFLNDVPGLDGVTYGLYDGNAVEVLQTPGLWGHDPKATDYFLPAGGTGPHAPPAASKALCARIEDLVAGARTWLDISLLWQGGRGTPALPDGHFWVALHRGFQRLADSGARPTVRILVGLPPPRLLPVMQSELCHWLREAVGTRPFPVYLAAQQTAVNLSWNHAKIIAADGHAVLVGGHNLWSVPYMDFAPIHDVSMLVRGPGASSAHEFLNMLWARPATRVCWEGGACRHDAEAAPAWQRLWGVSAVGHARVMPLGRLGRGVLPTFDKRTEASYAARIAAILMATTTVRASQQGLAFALGPMNGPLFAMFDPGTMAALARAAVKGVRLEVVISADGATDVEGVSYCPVPNAQTMRELCRYVEQELRFPGNDDPRNYLFRGGLALDVPVTARAASVVERQVVMAGLRFTDANDSVWEAPWQGRRQRVVPANHAKVLIVDDKAFYVGSDNMYKSGEAVGLQEFGYLVDSVQDTRNLLENYWVPLWRHSRWHRIPTATR